MNLEITQPTIHQNHNHKPAVLQRLLTRNFDHLREEATVPGFTAEEIDRIIQATADQLHRYTGPDEDAAFCRWLSEVVAPARDRERNLRFLAMIEAHNKVVKKAIWSILKKCSDFETDIEEAVSDLEAHVWLRVYEKVDAWIAPGFSNTKGKPPAKLSTRLYGFARFQAMRWRTDRLRERKALATIASLQREAECLDDAPRPRPIVLGPGDTDAYAAPAKTTAEETEELPEDSLAEADNFFANVA